MTGCIYQAYIWLFCLFVLIYISIDTLTWISCCLFLQLQTCLQQSVLWWAKQATLIFEGCFSHLSFTLIFIY